MTQVYNDKTLNLTLNLNLTLTIQATNSGQVFLEGIGDAEETSRWAGHRPHDEEQVSIDIDRVELRGGGGGCSL